MEQPTRRPFKLEQALEMLLSAYVRGQYVYAFDATNAYHDSCFHTTVSELFKKGIRFDKRPHEGTNHLDYKINPGTVQAAFRLLNHYRMRRKLLPVFSDALSGVGMTEPEAKALSFLVSAAKAGHCVTPRDAMNACGALFFARNVTALRERGISVSKEEENAESPHLSAYRLADESIPNAEALLAAYAQTKKEACAEVPS